MRCIVLSGSTVPFPALVERIDAALAAQLRAAGYTEIEVQYGHAAGAFQPVEGVTGFDFDPRIAERVRRADLVITHAGAGSLLDALERGLGPAHRRVVVVINPSLMNNHQAELALKLEQLGCVHVVHDVAKLQDAVEMSGNRGFAQLAPPVSLAPLLADLN